MANARRGYEAHLASEKNQTSEEAKRPRPVARPQLVRVNSVPVLAAPSTPADRIRRSGSGIPRPPSQADGGAAMLDGEAPAVEPTPPPEKRPLDTSSSTRKKKRSKKSKRGESCKDNGEGDDQDWENWGSEGWAWDGNEDSWYGDGDQAYWHGEGQVFEEGSAPVPPATELAAPVAEEVPPSSTTPGQGQHLAIGWEAPRTERSAANPPETKTAAKSKAQPPPNSGKGKGQALRVEQAVRVKVEQNTTDSTQQATQDNLRRANTSMQRTPGTREPDLEEMLDKEINKTPQEHGSSPAPTSTAAQPDPPHQAPAQQEAPQALAIQPAQGSQAAQVPPDGGSESISGAPKGRKEKTPAQKAAHARYMKFSRSFERISTQHTVYLEHVMEIDAMCRLLLHSTLHGA